MNSYIIMRLGIPLPTEEEIDLIREISKGEPIGGPIFPPRKRDKGIHPSGIITCLHSELTADEISEKFQEASIGLDNSEDEDGDVYPVMVFKIDESNFSYNRDMSLMCGWGEQFEEYFGKKYAGSKESKSTNSVKDLSLDDILDLMNERGGGIECLTKEEKNLFKQLTEKF